jgi:ATP-dependent Clp protease, protease subunit
MSQHNPIRCFDGNAKPHDPFWTFRNAAETESGAAELELYGVLSEYSWFEDDITPKKFKEDLYAYGKGGPVLLKINSPGGDVIAASVMRSIMTEYPGEITARVDGMAASAAVVVTMAAKTTQIMDTAYMMIHDPAVVVLLAVLDIETLGKLRDDLKAIKDGIVSTYATKTGLDEGKLSRMMADETWMSARQAVEYGFANSVIEGGQKSNASNVGFVNAMKNYEHVPPALMQALIPVNVPPALLSSEIEAVDDTEREAQSLREYVQLWK